MANGTTFDVMVMDVMLSWEQQRESKRSGGAAKLSANMSEEEMMAMLKNARKEAKDGG